MGKDRIEQIQKRLNWLSIELTHEGYLDGYSIEGFKKELAKLIEELNELQSNLKEE